MRVSVEAAQNSSKNVEATSCEVLGMVKTVASNGQGFKTGLEATDRLRGGSRGLFRAAAARDVGLGGKQVTVTVTADGRRDGTATEAKAAGRKRAVTEEQQQTFTW